MKENMETNIKQKFRAKFQHKIKALKIPKSHNMPFIVLKSVKGLTV
jgi:hypothetical protein